MSFIGIIASQKEFLILKTKILENIDINNVTIININKRSVSNIKNVKFEIIIICDDLEIIKENIGNINKICKDVKYIISNSDVLDNLNEIICNNSKIITYGLNRKAMITVSSIKEDSVLVALQSNLKNLEGNIIEVGESSVNLGENNKIKIYHILILYAIFLLYSGEKTSNTGKICFF